MSPGDRIPDGTITWLLILDRLDEVSATYRAKDSRTGEIQAELTIPRSHHDHLKGRAVLAPVIDKEESRQ